MKYMCCNCGAVIDEEDMSVYWDEDGKDERCPKCGGGDFEEAVKCLFCEEYFFESDLNNELCEDCIKGLMEDDDYVLYFAEEKNLVNELFNEIFDTKEQLSLLKMALEQDIGDIAHKRLKYFTEKYRQDIIDREAEDQRNSLKKRQEKTYYDLH